MFCTLTEQRKYAAQIRRGPVRVAHRPAAVAVFYVGLSAGCDQPTVHALPFTENAVGEALLLDQVPWNPNDVEPPPGTLAL